MNEYSKYIFLKSAVEDLFGSRAWYDLKESKSISVWRRYIEKTLKAIMLSIHTSVKYYDSDWIDEVDETIERGIDSLKKLKTIDELIAVLAGTLINISFLQIGLMPSRKGSDKKVTLRKSNWDLTRFRTVIYLQSSEQLESLFWSKQQKIIGSQNQIELYDKFRKTNSRLSYSNWCKKQNKT